MVAVAGAGDKSWAKMMKAHNVTAGSPSEEQSALMSDAVADAEKELCEAAAAADEAHREVVGGDDNTMVMSWDGGTSFHYGDPTRPIPSSTRRHAAESRAFCAVVAKDAAAAPTQELREAQQLRRGVYVWWLVRFAQMCDENWTTADVVRLKVRPLTRRRRCRFTELVEMGDKTGPAAVFVSHTWGARFRELVAAVAYALPPETLVWVDIFAVRQWPGNGGDIDFRPVVYQTNALLLIARHLEQVAAITPSAIIHANCQLDMRGDESATKNLQFVMRNTLRELPSDELTTCAFFRIWCVVELVAALMAEIPVLMLVGSEDRTAAKGRRDAGLGAAAGYLVAGAGSSKANGSYLRDGLYEGVPLFKNGNWWLLRYTLGEGNVFWYIADKDQLEHDAGDLYRVKCDDDEPPLGGWLKAVDGVLPAPTLSRLEAVPAEGEGEPADVEEAEEGTPLGPFVPNSKMLDTLLEVVDVGKAIASVEADRVRELGGVHAGVGVVRANGKARGAIVGAKHAMGVVPVLHAAATRNLEPLSSLRDPVERAGALIGASAVGLTAGVQVLLERGLDGELNGDQDAFSTQTRDAALVAAACGGHVGALRLLLGQAPAPEPRAVEAAFLRACGAGQPDTVGLLLDAGAPLEARDSSNWTGLILGALCGSTDLCELLLQRGALINAADHNKWTAIIWAADRQQEAAVRFFIDRGAIIQGAMWWARKPEIVEMLTAVGGVKGDQGKLTMREGVVFLDA